MSTALTLRDLDPRDVFVLWDLIRFGSLASDQIDRRYGKSAVTSWRLPVLLEADLIWRWSNGLQGATVYSATRRAVGLTRFALRHRATRYEHLAHDIAVVDLADYLLAHDPEATWRAENEIGLELKAAANGAVVAGPDHRHVPDGLLLTDGKRIGVELEHTIKTEVRYAHICRWFAEESRIAEVHWYTDNPRINDRIRKVSREHVQRIRISPE